MRCVLCDSHRVAKIIMLGFPLKACYDCSCIWGLWGFEVVLFKLSGGVMMVYEGSYWRGLWEYLKGPGEDDL